MTGWDSLRLRRIQLHSSHLRFASLALGFVCHFLPTCLLKQKWNACWTNETLTSLEAKLHFLLRRCEFRLSRPLRLCRPAIVLPAPERSRPAAGHADVVDNCSASTVEDCECAAILSRWRTALGCSTLHLGKEGRIESLTAGRLYYYARCVLGAKRSHRVQIQAGGLAYNIQMQSPFLFLIALITAQPREGICRIRCSYCFVNMISHYSRRLPHWRSLFMRNTNPLYMCQGLIWPFPSLRRGSLHAWASHC